MMARIGFHKSVRQWGFSKPDRRSGPHGALCAQLERRQKPHMPHCSSRTLELDHARPTTRLAGTRRRPAYGADEVLLRVVRMRNETARAARAVRELDHAAFDKAQQHPGTGE